MVNEIIMAFVPIVMGTVGYVVKRQVDTNDKVTDLDKRQAVYEAKIDGLTDLINSRFDSFDHRVERIERSLNGHLHRE